MPFELNGIGGIVQPANGSESIGMIPQNTTLMVMNGTADAPVKPEVVQGLSTINQVFDHFAPAVDLEMETEEGTVQKETICFQKIGDFGIDGISTKSRLLHDLSGRKEANQKMIMQLKRNKLLQQALADTTTRQSFIQTLQALIAELDETV